MTVEELVNLLAKSTNSFALSDSKTSTRKPKYDVLIELQNGEKTRVRRILSENRQPNQVMLDAESGIRAKVLQSVRTQ